MSVVRNISWKFDIIQIFPSLALKAERERKRYCSCVFSGLCSCRTVFEFAQSLSSQNIGLTTIGIAVRCQKDDNSQCYQGQKIFRKEPFWTHLLQYCQVAWQRLSSLSDDLLIFITALNQCLIFLIPISFRTHPCLNALNKSTVFKRPKRHSSLTTVWKDWRKNGSTCIARGWIKNVSGADRDLADQAIQQLQLAFHGRSSHVVNRPAALYFPFSKTPFCLSYLQSCASSQLLLRFDVSQRAIRKRSSFSPFDCRWHFFL